jgi:hypothetical protein
MESIRRAAVVSIFAIASLATTAWAQKDAALGSWKLNVAKSTIRSMPAPRSATVTFEQSGKGVKSVQDVVAADGKKSTVSYTAEYNGKDYPMAGSANADTVALKYAGGNTVQRVDKKGGKIVTTWSRTISGDGKTMTATQKGTSADGKPVDNTWVFDRVN